MVNFDGKIGSLAQAQRLCINYDRFLMCKGSNVWSLPQFSNDHDAAIITTLVKKFYEGRNFMIVMTLCMQNKRGKLNDYQMIINHQKLLCMMCI